jgi:hypothetical protein
VIYLKKLIRLLIKPATLLLEKKFNKNIQQVLKLSPITHLHPEDIFVIGYPKSGNTWFQNLIAGTIYGLDTQYTPDTIIQDLIPDIHYKKYYKRIKTPMFFKSHALPKPEFKNVIYLLRDGRDVMVSYLHHLTALNKGVAVDFLDMIKNGKGLYPCKWHDHISSWISNPYASRMMTIRYEDLKTDPKYELKRICQFINIQRDDIFLKNVAENASFDKMKEREERFSWDNKEWPRDKKFIRRGKIGSYQDEMPNHVLETFMDEASEMLNKCGYV